MTQLAIAYVAAIFILELIVLANTFKVSLKTPRNAKTLLI